MVMGKSVTSGFRAAVVSATALLFAAHPASAQELSEKSVRTFMDYAWSLTPAKFTKPDGVSILIDKNDRSKVDIPIETAREVIKVGRLSAHAQICELLEDQVANYRSLMKREEAKKKWTDQQLIYINQLHLTTVMLLLGKVKLVEQDQGSPQAILEESKKEPEARTCTDEQRKKVKELIAAYVKTGPALTPPANAAQAPAPVKK
jgi:exonuclease III